MKRKRNSSEKVALEETNCKKMSLTKCSQSPGHDHLPKIRKWTISEKSIVSGVVMTVFADRHSLQPSEAEERMAEELGWPSSRVVWMSIHKRYKIYCQRWEAISGEKCKKRSMNEIREYWHNSGDIDQGDMSPAIFHQSDSLQQFLLFHRKYNKDNLLTCSLSKFLDYLDSRNCSHKGDEPCDLKCLI